MTENFSGYKKEDLLAQATRTNFGATPGLADFAVKDSGERQRFESGMQRDVTEGKTRYDLVFDGPLLDRYAKHLTKGAMKYSARNWMLANGQKELDRFRESAARHFIQWFRGEVDEDHAAAVVFNINGALYVEQRMRGEEEDPDRLSNRITP